MRDRTVSPRAATPTALAGVLVAVLAGCGPTAAAGPVAAVQPAADCRAPAVLAALGLEPGTDASAAPATSGGARSAVAAPGAVPDDFRATGVVVCTRGGTARDVEGLWTTVSEQVLEGDLAGLVDALARTSGPSSPAGRTAVVAGGPEEGCAAAVLADGGPALWLVDALGRAVWVQVPGAACAAASAAVADELAGLDETDATDWSVALAVPRATVTPAAPSSS
ncbi:hypothetical protein [Cellulomonas marina]|uniref:Uncharacterized protein n=1 Tax=Cellulomonas marina TaxID=988821 RepID=A0A1I0XPT7_9CELL|nr:hypothetical protein [Cellulomonas marina]GIG30046.1 hypothetical protein Cma02nite_26460 [Cellulomonas marina]SFB02982.1 hypothetical protein SAMN05421867_105208 [Cellulomonas marina]